jgi:hypothetical protein
MNRNLSRLRPEDQDEEPIFCRSLADDGFRRFGATAQPG